MRQETHSVVDQRSADSPLRSYKFAKNLPLSEFHRDYFWKVGLERPSGLIFVRILSAFDEDFALREEKSGGIEIAQVRVGGGGDTRSKGRKHEVFPPKNGGPPYLVISEIKEAAVNPESFL